MPPFHSTHGHNGSTDNPTPLFNPPPLPNGPKPVEYETRDRTASTIAEGELDTILPAWPFAGVTVSFGVVDLDDKPLAGREVGVDERDGVGGAKLSGCCGGRIGQWRGAIGSDDFELRRCMDAEFAKKRSGSEDSVRASI
ncbi:hypothetical protein B0A55_06865 [Friedmanniomyces simplex]|uniref:Uncharacterized protein n=1 Tax=Friedmanniomyces simplex TaxID=329884 RepID=A0A4V5NEQ8_9PEZI|nr:hypothetical protein B0A55_06865 [Friedmanniomyces simplex]